MRTNVAPKPVRTFEGGTAARTVGITALKRAVSSCLLWEDQFYESGEDIATRIESLSNDCKAEEAAELAVYARTQLKLRHAPLLLVKLLAARKDCRGTGISGDRSSNLVSKTLTSVIQRADELAEFLSLYWKGGKTPISKQVKLGLAAAFNKFDEYQFAKYNRDSAIKLRDVMFMVRPKPKDEKQAGLFKKIANNELATPDTWEVALSSGADKRETFERLIREGKLGYMALLRNLRNMQQSGVPAKIVKDALLQGAQNSKALPYRFIAAARACPQWEPFIDEAMQVAATGLDKVGGRTAVVIDVSGSMFSSMSSKSDLQRIDAACGLAIMLASVCDDVRVFTFSNSLIEVPPRKGMALRDAIVNSQHHGGTDLGGAVARINSKSGEFDRVVVITDEQSSTSVSNPKCAGYMINVASYRNGVGYGGWTKIDGFSESVVRFIGESEAINDYSI